MPMAAVRYFYHLKAGPLIPLYINLWFAMVAERTVLWEIGTNAPSVRHRMICAVHVGLEARTATMHSSVIRALMLLHSWKHLMLWTHPLRRLRLFSVGPFMLWSCATSARQTIYRELDTIARFAQALMRAKRAIRKQNTDITPIRSCDMNGRVPHSCSFQLSVPPARHLDPQGQRDP